MPEENENGNGKEEIQSKGLVRVLEILANKKIVLNLKIYRLKHVQI